MVADERQPYGGDNTELVKVTQFGMTEEVWKVEDVRWSQTGGGPTGIYQW